LGETGRLLLAEVDVRVTGLRSRPALGVEEEAPALAVKDVERMSTASRAAEGFFGGCISADERGEEAEVA
jgi:hypothetical protein